MRDENRFQGIVFDRSMILRTTAEKEEFANSPKEFLEKAGALEGIEEFNGFWCEEAGRVDDDGGRFTDESFRAAIVGARGVHVVHVPTPYIEACKHWIIIDNL